MILNRQRGVRVSIPKLEDFLARARGALGVASESLTVCLVTPAEMARWNRAYRGKNRPTDVLSFPTIVSDPRNEAKGRGQRARPRRTPWNSASPRAFSSAGFSKAYLGDIAIAPAVARDNARRFGRTFDDEMRILILHGMLHLMGYDHEMDNGQMERREQRLRKALGLK